jgi:hypothetical protein
VLVNLGLFDPSTSGTFSQAHFFGNLVNCFARLNHKVDGIGFLLGCKFSAWFLGHLNILLRYRLFGNVHFFGGRSLHQTQDLETGEPRDIVQLQFQLSQLR